MSIPHVSSDLTIRHVRELMRHAESDKCGIEIFAGYVAHITKPSCVALLTLDHRGTPRLSTRQNDDPCWEPDESDIDELCRKLVTHRKSATTMALPESATVSTKEVTKGFRTQYYYCLGGYAVVVVVLPWCSTGRYQQQESGVNQVLQEFALRLRHLQVEAWARGAVQDSLTPLLSKQAFPAQSNAIFIQARLHRMPISLAIMDLDNFKQLNSELLYKPADEVLKCVGSMIREAIPDTVAAGRVGGDEFKLIFNGDGKFATDVMMAVLNVFADLKPQFSDPKDHRKFEKFKEKWGFSASVGIATWVWDAHSTAGEASTTYADEIELATNELDRRANEALLVAKQRKEEKVGINVVMYDELEQGAAGV